MKRRIALLLLLFNSALSAADVDPQNFVRDIYSLYSKDGPGVQILDHGKANALFDPSLASLIERVTRKAHGETSALDFDPICACQDYDITNVRVSLLPRENNETRVAVSFDNLNQSSEIRLNLTQTRAGWQIHDIATHDIPSLRAFLRHSVGPE
jgi:hypothetical protein